MDAGHYADRDRVTVAEATQRLGISEQAVRKRLKRGTLEGGRGEDGIIYIYLDAGQSGESAGQYIGQSSGQDASYPDTSALLDEKDARIEDLREQLEAEREANRENRRIIAGMSQANAELSRTVRELEVPDSDRSEDEESREEATHGSENASEESYPSEPAGGSESSPERPDSERRPWWRRIFGA